MFGWLLRHSRIELIAQCVAGEIEPDNEHRNGQARNDGQVWRIEQVRPPRVEHSAPAGRGRLHTEAEKTQ